MGLGERLREERERLALSSGEFAERACIHRNTLARYESGDRQPPAGFFDTLARMGVDIEYLMTGVRLSSDELEWAALWELLHEFGNRLGVGVAPIKSAVIAVVGEKDRERHGRRGGIAAGRAVADILSSSPALVMNADLLANVLESIDASLARSGRTMTADRKAKAVIALYRASKGAGKVDVKLADDLVAMAG